MSAKLYKLIRQYAKRFKEDPKALKRKYFMLPREGQQKLRAHMIDWLQRMPFDI